MRLIAAVACALLACLSVAAPALAEKRVALVIGNSAYQKVAKLPNPTRDAAAIGDLFRAVGFDTVQIKSDLDQAALRRALRDFSDAVRDADIAVVFYAGHGIEVGGTNYLVPVDAALERDLDVEDETVSLDRVNQILEPAKRLRVVILDACRDNPFASGMKRTLASRSVGRGLARVDIAAADSMVAFAAKPGSTAADGQGANSPYTTALLKHLATPGLDLRLAMGRVRDEVLAATGRRQEPIVFTSLGGAEVALVPGKAGAAAPQPPDPAAQAWAVTQNATSVAVLDDFIRQFGATPYGSMARARVDELKKSRVAIIAPPVAPAAPPTPVRPAVGVFTPAPGVNPLSPERERGLKPKDTFKECDVCPEMVVVPAGRFTMGSPASEKGRGSDESPQHTVTFAKPFAAGKFSVTFLEWNACAADGGCNGYMPSHNGWGYGNRPVINVSWDDAKAYAAWLSKKTGKSYRLLSEAEREYATRASTTTPFWWGSSISTSQANYNGTYTYGNGPKGEYRQRTIPVDSFQPNPFGLYQVHGNVWEWTEDCKSDSYAGAPSDGSARTAGDCDYRVLRGGSWGNSPGDLRAAGRHWNFPFYRFDNFGFRLARTLTADEQKVTRVAVVAPPVAPAAPPSPVQPAVGVFTPSLTFTPLSPERERSLKPKDTFKECDLCPEMVVVPAGRFTMGSPASEKGRSSDEGPQHTVTIAKPFAAGKFSVTFAEWDACVADGGCNGYKPLDAGWGRGNRPVIRVSWNDAKTYVAWLSRKTGKTYRLLSEAEREYVSRAGTTTPFWWGSSISTAQANYHGDYTYGSGSRGEHRKQTLPVDSFQPNPFGLYQVHGNVWDWTEDCYRDSYAGAPSDGSAWTSGDCNGRVLRGGAWLNVPGGLRAAERLTSNPGFRDLDNGAGFRLARTLTADEQKVTRVAVVAPPVAPAAPPTPVQPAVGVFTPSPGVNPLSPERERSLKPKDTFKECDACPEMVVVPAGRFTMGSPASEKERDKGEGPQHAVTIGKPFAVGKFSVTFAQWDACVADGGCNGHKPLDLGWGRGDRPVINVSWNGAKAYVAWLSHKTGKTYRLLSEAEREYVTRAGTTTPFWWGSSISTTQANYHGNYTYGNGPKGEYRAKTLPVDSFQPNPFGLYQVHGNTHEWTEDCYHDSYAGAPSDGSAWTSGDCKYRVVRGGSWGNSPGDLRAARRGGNVAGGASGFRLARTL